MNNTTEYHDVTDAGERVSPDEKSWGFYGHLSIYLFALPYIQNKRVLDAGSGTGYGAHYFATHGASSVIGIDLSEKAVAFSQQRYRASNLSYQQMSLEALSFPENTRFDVIFTSNVLEHIANPDEFLHRATRLLAPDGIFIMAVPPVTSTMLLELNLTNPYHINNLPPAAWGAKLERFFDHFQGYRHWMPAQWIGSDNMPIGIAGPPEETVVRETDYTFTPQTIDELSSPTPNITFIAVAENPRPTPLPPNPAVEYLHLDWYRQALRQAVLREALLKHQLAQAQAASVGTTNTPTHEELTHLASEHQRAEIAEAELRRIHGTRGWRFLLRYWSFKQRLLGK